MAYYERQPYIQSLHSLLGEVLKGEIRVPRFNRPGTEETWRPEQRRELLDSIYRGFPIGTILLWSTAEPIATYHHIGGLQVPQETDPTRPLRLLLDGHQRVSTLVQVFGRAVYPGDELANPEDKQERWFFDLDAGAVKDARDPPFVAHPWSAEPEAHLLPLDIVLDRRRLNRWTRERTLNDEQLLLIDAVRDRFREYNMPVAVLQTDALNDATESFQRINSGGTQMSRYHMVNALAFQHDFDPQQQWDHAKEEILGGTFWVGDGRPAIIESDILRVCAALDDADHPSKIDIRQTARRLSQKRINRTFDAIRQAATEFEAMGIHGPQTLPYSWQLITLSIFLSQEEVISNASALERWLWLTTYGEVFAGVQSSIYDRSLKALRAMAAGGTEDAMRRDMRPRVSDVERFDYRSARSRACALAMARHQDGNVRNGKAHLALAEEGAGALQLLDTRGRRSEWWNLVIQEEKGQIGRWRKALHDPATATEDDLRKLALLPLPADRSPKSLLATRRERLLAEERRFVENLGLLWDDTQGAGPGLDDDVKDQGEQNP